ncbi:hypothetical protein DUI87_21007 [Hirundo rustica rustica]|uniref:PA domain-containing protein n=1 Tax=Hirundo rustica rustica TaxID=333673 RepID=A0A3M0JLD5_HIRRU|nr:hypothetical protein DUI87_21007 [Hirundo rustica rustica]
MLLSIGMLMLSATQIYTIVTVQLFAFLNLLPVEADILAYNLENGTETFDDLPARFGYRLPAEGLKGFLINSKPENACEPIAPPPLRDNSSGAFIVLIRRLECNFDVKVLNAQRAGYKAAIVHNVDSDDLISMGSNDIEVLKKIDIPSVFIGEKSANSLKEEFTYEKGVSLQVCGPVANKNKKTCPVCKQKVVPSQGDSDSETDSSQEENEVSENTPLLRPLASVSTQSFGALSESRSHQNMTESSEYEEDDNDNVDSSDVENGMSEESVVVQLQPSEDREYRVANTV